MQKLHRLPISATVMCELISKRALSEIPTDTVYHIISGGDFELARTLDSWAIVQVVLQNKMATNRVLDIVLPYSLEGSIYKGRYIIANNNLVGVRIDTSQEIVTSVWTRHLTKKIKLPSLITSRFPHRQDEFIVGQFNLAFANVKIALLFGDQARRAGTLLQYKKYGFDVLAITDENSGISYIESLRKDSEKSKITYVYCNAQYRTKEASILKIGGAAIIELGEIKAHIPQLSFKRNPTTKRTLNLLASRMEKNYSSLELDSANIIPNIQINMFLSGNNIDQIDIESIQSKEVQIIQKYKYLIWDIFRKNEFVPFVCEWDDNPKNLVLICLIKQLCEDIEMNFSRDQQTKLIERDIKNKLLCEMLLIYQNRKAQYFNNFQIMNKVKQEIDVNFIESKNISQVLNDQKTNLLKQSLDLVEKTLPYVTSINNKGRYVLCTQSRVKLEAFKILNHLYEEFVFICIDMFSFEEVKVLASKLVHGSEKQLKTLITKYLRCKQPDNELFKYFQNLNIKNQLQQEKFDILKFKAHVSKQLSFQQIYIESLEKYYIPKLISTPLSVTHSATQYFLFMTTDQRDLHGTYLHSQKEQSQSPTNLRPLSQYILQIDNITKIQKRCHKCNFNFDFRLGVNCTTLKCSKFFCFKCLDKQYNRFTQFQQNKKLDDCPVCLKQCQCYKCLKSHTKKISSKGNKRLEQLLSEPCHMCKEKNTIRANCDKCSTGYCLKCIKKNFEQNFVLTNQRWQCYMCKQQCICQLCQLKKAAVFNVMKKTEKESKTNEEFQIFKNLLEAEKNNKMIGQNNSLFVDYERMKELEEEQKKKFQKELEIQRNFANSWAPIEQNKHYQQKQTIDEQYNKFFKEKKQVRFNEKLIDQIQNQTQTEIANISQAERNHWKKGYQQPEQGQFGKQKPKDYWGIGETKMIEPSNFNKKQNQYQNQVNSQQNLNDEWKSGNQRSKPHNNKKGIFRNKEWKKQQDNWGSNNQSLNQPITNLNWRNNSKFQQQLKRQLELQITLRENNSNYTQNYNPQANNWSNFNNDRTQRQDPRLFKKTPNNYQGANRNINKEELKDNDQFNTNSMAFAQDTAANEIDY